MSLFVFDRSEQLQLEIRETAAAADQNLLYYTDPIHTEDTQGLNLFEFKIPADHSDGQYIKENYLVGFFDQDGNFQLFEIKEIKENHSSAGLMKIFYCEHAYYEILDEIIEDLRPGSCTAAYALSQALTGSTWQAGTVDNLGTNTINFYYESRKSALNRIRETWGGEIRLRVIVTGGVITAKYIDLLTRRGSDTGKIFEYTKDLTEVEKYTNSKDLITAAYGRGKGQAVGENSDGTTYGRRTNFKDIVWTVAGGKAADKPAGQEWIGDPAALAAWGRNGRHRMGIFKDDEETDPANLLLNTWNYVQANNKPKNTYTLKVQDLERLTGYSHEAVRLGDGIHAIDKEFSPALYLDARIIKIERNLLNPTNTVVTLGNYIEDLASNNTDQSQAIDDFRDRQGIYDKLGAGHVSTAWLEGQINALQNMINAGGGTVTVTDTDGILIVDNAATPTKALRLLGGALAIANSKTGAAWNWRSFGTGDGFTANEMKTGKLTGGRLSFDLDNGILKILDTSGAWNMAQFTASQIIFGKNSGRQFIVNSDGSVTMPKITAQEIEVSSGEVAQGNIALAKTITGSAGITGTAYVNDGDTTAGGNYCSFPTGAQNNNAAENGYIQIDLGQTYRITESRIFFYAGDARSYWYKIKYSIDGTNWFYAIGNAANNGWVTSPMSVGLPVTYFPTIDNFTLPISARYVRLYANGSNQNTGNHIHEWELYCGSGKTIISNGQIYGGTLTLGGGSNGNGLLNLKDTANNIVGTFDNTGIRLKTGTFKILSSSYAGSYDSQELQLTLSSNRIDITRTSANGGTGTYYSGTGWSISDFTAGAGGDIKLTNTGSNDWTLYTGGSVGFYMAQGKFYSFTNQYGLINIGAESAAWASFYTDRPNYYMNKPLRVETEITIYNGGVYGVYLRGNSIDILATSERQIRWDRTGNGDYTGFYGNSGTVGMWDWGGSTGIWYYNMGSDTMNFQKKIGAASTSYPHIYGDGSYLQMCSGNDNTKGIVMYQGAAGALRPCSDNNLALGDSSWRWKTVYAVTGSINTSDRNKKNTINSLDDELTKDFIMGLDPVSYKMNDGESGRTHYGLISQDVEQLLEDIGVSSMDFAGFIKSPKKTAEIVTDEDGNESYDIKVIENEFDYALRYEEFISPLIKMVQIQYNKIIDLEERINILEGI